MNWVDLVFQNFLCDSGKTVGGLIVASINNGIIFPCWPGGGTLLCAVWHWARNKLLLKVMLCYE